MGEKSLAIYHERVEGVSRRKQYRVMSVLTFCVAVLLPVLRLINYWIPINIGDPTTAEIVGDLIFTLPMQLIALVAVPVLFYVFLLKKNVREIFEFSNFKPTKWYNLVLAVPIGLCCHIVTLFVTTVWQNMLIMLGFNHGSSYMPEQFSAGFFITQLILTGILPAFCEEFFNRGGLLSTVRGSFPLYATVVIMGIEFGLFHQYITQVFYTALFGGFMAYLCLKLKSVWPCVIIHFVNNTFSVINSHFSEYGIMGGGLYGMINDVAATRPAFVLLFYFLGAILLGGLVVLLMYLNSNKRLEKKKEVIMDSGFDHTHNRVVLIGAEDKEKVRELGLDKEVYGYKLKEDLFKPTLKDNAFFIGAIVVTALTTIFSFVFGWVAA